MQLWLQPPYYQRQHAYPPRYEQPKVLQWIGALTIALQ
jgi:hypothetical protein